MRTRIMVGCSVALFVTFVLGSAPAMACGWRSCDTYGYYPGPAHTTALLAAPAPTTLLRFTTGLQFTLDLLTALRSMATTAAITTATMAGAATAVGAMVGRLTMARDGVVEVGGGDPQALSCYPPAPLGTSAAPPSTPAPSLPIPCPHTGCTSRSGWWPHRGTQDRQHSG
jgi:hypothetical protein